jgi:hypothetical protein
MEKTVVATIAGGYAGLVVPADMIELIRLVSSDGVKLIKDDITTINQLALTVGLPRLYCREGGVWLIGPAPGIGDTIKIVYYAELGDLINPTDTNVISTIASDLISYAALPYAADFYSDRRAKNWETRYTQILGDLQQQADDDELSGGASVSPALQYPDELCW